MSRKPVTGFGWFYRILKYFYYKSNSIGLEKYDIQLIEIYDDIFEGKDSGEGSNAEIEFFNIINTVQNIPILGVHFGYPSTGTSFHL